MSAAARRRRAAAKANPYTSVLPGVLRRPTGCLARCPDCYARCLSDDADHAAMTVDEWHTFPCDH